MKKKQRRGRAVTSKRTLDRLSTYPEEVLIAVCRQFISGEMSADEVAKVVTDAYPSFPISRQQVFTAMRVAVQKGWMRLTPPGNEALQEQLSSRFDKGTGSICVAAHEPGLTPTDQVANKGASLAFNAIMEAAKTQEEVHVGLGGGLTMFKVCQILLRELGAVSELPRLTVHSLTSGFHSIHPQYSPNGLLNLFAHLPNVRFVALMAPPFIKAREYQRAIRNWEGLQEALEHRNNLDLILSSVGSAEDPDDQLRKALLQVTPKKQRRLDCKMVGDILSLPYGVEGPLSADQFSRRSVSLFQLEELRGFVRDRQAGKKRPLTYLFASSCSFCGRPKTAAIRPLLRDNLRVWTKLVIDTATAKDLLNPTEGLGAGPSLQPSSGRDVQSPRARG